jgi:hypothetical protein
MYIYVIAPKRMGSWMEKGRKKDVLFLMAHWLLVPSHLTASIERGPVFRVLIYFTLPFAD